MTFLKAHYDGEHIVLDEAADLKPGQKVIVLSTMERYQKSGSLCLKL